MIKNFDSFFWELTSTDTDVDVIASNKVISASVTEEMGAMDSCVINMLDPNCIYSRIFRNGSSFKFGWGDLINRRSPIEFLINSPSGSADVNGQITYNMRGQSMGDMVTNRKYYSEGTKGLIVRSTLLRMGIVDVEIDFSRMNEVINNDSKIAQYESDFRFLARLADEWRCVFKIGTTKIGTTCAVFCEPFKLRTLQFVNKIVYSSTVLEYGGGLSNVIEYSWQDNSLDSACGTNVQIRNVNGQMQFYRYIAESETVITYRLNEDAIRDEYNDQEDIQGKMTFIKEVLSAKNFAEVERFFIQDTVTTAPQGSGLTISVRTFGDPNVTAGQIATFGVGFPDRIGAKDRIWYIKSVTHSMGMNGYFCDLEIQDAYAFSPTGEKL